MSDALTSKEQCREQFDMWAENLGLCMDELFMSSTGVPENPFEDQDTKSFYMAWLAAWEACEVLRSAHEPETVRTTDATLNAGLDKLRAIANGQVVKISPLQASLVLDYVRASEPPSGRKMVAADIGVSDLNEGPDSDEPDDGPCPDRRCT